MPSVDGRESARSGGNIRAEQDPRMVFSQNDSEEAVLSQKMSGHGPPKNPNSTGNRALSATSRPYSKDLKNGVVQMLSSGIPLQTAASYKRCGSPQLSSFCFKKKEGRREYNGPLLRDHALTHTTTWLHPSLKGQSSWQVNPTFNFHPAFVPSANPPKERVVGGRRMMQDWSEDMLTACKDKRLDIIIRSNKDETRDSRLNVLNPQIVQHLAHTAMEEVSAHEEEMSASSYYLREEAARKQEELRVQQETSILDMRASLKIQREKQFEEESERIKFELRDRVKKKQVHKEMKFEEDYRRLKKEFEELVEGHIDPKLERFQTVKDQSRRNLHTTYHLEVIQKMHAQVLPQIDKIEANEITKARNELYQKYLDASNRKKIYLDEVDQADYDPFAWPPKILKYVGGSASNCAVRGDDADIRLGENPTQRELLKAKREKQLSSAINGNNASSNMKGTSGFVNQMISVQRQSNKTVGNPHMQTQGKLSDLNFRETLEPFWWSENNYKNSQHYDRVMEANAKREAAQNSGNSTVGTFQFDDYNVPRSYEQRTVLDGEFQTLYGKGKRCTVEKH